VARGGLAPWLALITVGRLGFAFGRGDPPLAFAVARRRGLGPRDVAPWQRLLDEPERPPLAELREAPTPSGVLLRRAEVRLADGRRQHRHTLVDPPAAPVPPAVGCPLLGMISQRLSARRLRRVGGCEHGHTSG
jgi:hypothetical protein